MTATTLTNLLGYAEQHGFSAADTAAAVGRWRDDMTAQGALRTDARGKWDGIQALDADTAPVLESLRDRAMAETTAAQFPDPEERASFLRVLESSNWDPDNMDAPEDWVSKARAIDSAGAAPVFKRPRYQQGTIGLGPNVLGQYVLREKEDGSGYAGAVFPTVGDKKPVELSLPPRDVMAKTAGERLALMERDLEMNAPDLSMGEVGGGWAGGAALDTLMQRRDAAARRYDLISKGKESQAIHAGVDTVLQNTPEFLSQIPNNWASQFTVRPLLQAVRGMAQAGASVGVGDQRALTAEGASALEVATPGALRNRFANGEDGTPIADMITSGIESFATIIGPGAALKGVAAALPATNSARAAALAREISAAMGMNPAATPEALAGWSSMYVSAYGQNYAQGMQTAEAMAQTDPAGAERLRRWNGVAAALKAGIELATEKIFPGEMDLLAGGARGFGRALAMPFTETVEESVGAVAQNQVNALTGNPTREDPYEAGKGGFFGAAPFMLGSAGRAAMEAPEADGSVPMDNRLVADPPPEESVNEGGIMAEIAARGGRSDEPMNAAPPSETPAEGQQQLEPLEETREGQDPKALPEAQAGGPDGALFESSADTEETLADGTPNVLPNRVTPEEAQTFQAAQDAWTEANPETATQPEPLRTLAGQLDLVKEGTKPAMIFEGVKREDLPKAMRPLVGMGTLDGVETAGGFVVFHKGAIREALGMRAGASYTAVQTAARTAFNNPERAGILLGYGTAEKPADADRVVTVRDEQGVETLAVAANAATEPEVAAALERVGRRRPQTGSAENFRSSPLAEFVMSQGGVMSKSTARREGLWQGSKAMWDDAPARLADPRHNTVYGTVRPDELAQAAYDRGLLTEASVPELWAKLGQESSQAARAATAAKEQQQEMDRMERLARREDPEYTLAMRAAAREEEARQAARQRARKMSSADEYSPRAPEGRAPMSPPDVDMPFARAAAARGKVSAQAGGQALELVRQTLPGVADGVRLVQNRTALEEERDQYRPEDWAGMGPLGAQGFFNPTTGQTTVILDNVDVRPGDTPLRATARIILHERVAHAGLAALRETDPLFAAKWAQLIAKIPQEELAATAERYTELSGNRAALAEEWLAEQVEARAGKLLTPGSLARRMWDAVREALRRVFARFSRVESTQAEVDEVIRLAVAALRARAAGETTAVSGRMSARGVESAPTVRGRNGRVVTGPLMWAIRAYHGTPHRVDKFTTARINTGEGAQSFGWGLYFAESGGIGHIYRTRLTNRDFINKVREVYDEDSSPADAVEALKDAGLNDAELRLVDALSNDEWLGFDYPHQAVSAALKEPHNFELSLETVDALAGMGNHYTVEITVEEGDLLDWDGQMSQKQIDMLRADPIFAANEFHATGSYFYQHLAGPGGVKLGGGTPEKASKRLAALGIPGIKFWDGNSRKKGEGQRNFVVFEEKNVRIVEENGKPVGMAEAAAVQFARPGRRSDVAYAGTGAFRVQNQRLRAVLTGNALPKELTAVLQLGTHESKALQASAAAVGADLREAIQAHMKRHSLTEAAVLARTHAAMEDPAVLASIADPKLRDATRKARNLLDDMSEAIATITGGQMGSAIMGNRGHWMRRAYAAFDPAAGWHYDAMVEAAKAKRDIAGRPAAAILKGAQDFLRAEDPRRTDGQIEAIIRGIMDRGTWERHLSGQGVSKPVESLMRRRDIPAELRAVMGEEHNPLKRFTHSAGFQSAFIARHEQQRRMGDIGLRMGIFSTERTGVYTEALSDGAPTPQGQRRSGFAGLYTTPEMKAALNSGQGITPDKLSAKVMDALKFLGAEAKLNKVALNPDSWMVNIIGNVIGLVQTGDLLSFRAFPRMAQAGRLMRSGRAITDNMTAAQTAVREQLRATQARLHAAGVADSSATIQDLEASLNNRTLQFIEADNRWNRASGGVRGVVMGQGFGRIFGTVGQAAGAVIGGAAGTVAGGKRITDAQKTIADWVLGAPDRWGKITAFLGNYEAHRAAGMVEAAAFRLAAEKTLDTMPDYSKIPELARELSKIGVMGSFIAFQIEVYRNAYHNLRYGMKELRSGNPAMMARGAKRLLGVAATQALAAGGFSAIVAGIYGKALGDDDDEAYRRSLARPWEKFGKLAYTGFDSEKAGYFNTAYLVPQVTMHEITRAALEGRSLPEALGNAATASANQFFGGGVHTDPLLESLLNARKDGSKVSYKEGAPQWAERFMYYVRRALEPGAVDKGDRIARAMEGRDRGSRKFSVEEEGLRLLGVRHTTYRHEDAIRTALYALDRRYTDVQTEARRRWRSNEPGDRAAALAEANETIGRIVRDAAELKQDLARLDLSELADKVNENRNSEGHSRRILPKKFRPLVATPDGPKFAE